MPVAAVVGATIVGSAISGNAQKKAAKSAANAQSAASQAEIEARQQQFEAVQKLLAPYNEAGTAALTSSQNLIGLNGNAPQAAAIKALEQSPAFTSMLRSGENAILQNASATGGLRGGNTQGALAQFRPDLLAQLIESQYSKLGGLVSVGQNAAAGTGNAGLQTVNGIGGALQQQGAAQAGAALARGQVNAGFGSAIGQLGGFLGGIGQPTFAAPTASFGSGASYGGLGNSLSIGAGF